MRIIVLHTPSKLLLPVSPPTLCASATLNKTLDKLIVFALSQLVVLLFYPQCYLSKLFMLPDSLGVSIKILFCAPVLQYYSALILVDLNMLLCTLFITAPLACFCVSWNYIEVRVNSGGLTP